MVCHGLGGSPKFLGVHKNHHELLEQLGTARTTVAVGPPLQPFTASMTGPNQHCKGGAQPLVEMENPKGTGLVPMDYNTSMH